MHKLADGLSGSSLQKYRKRNGTLKEVTDVLQAKLQEIYICHITVVKLLLNIKMNIQKTWQK
jgi:hypothetical protein